MRRSPNSLTLQFSTPGWDLGLDASLLLVGTLNALYGTVDIYDDTILRTDTRSDAYRFAALHPGVLTSKCVGFTWLALALLAFAAAVFVFLLLEQAGDASLSWWVFLPGPMALVAAILVRTYDIYRQNSSRWFSFRFWLVNLVPRPTKTHNRRHTDAAASPRSPCNSWWVCNSFVPQCCNNLDGVASHLQQCCNDQAHQGRLGQRLRPTIAHVHPRIAGP